MRSLEDDALDRTLNDAWKDPDRPPWDVENTPIEHEKLDLLAPHLTGVTSVLDCGCGGGDFFRMVVRRAGQRFPRAVGLDVAAGALARAGRTGNYDQLVKGLLSDASKLVEGTFDLVLLSDVLSHVRDPILVPLEVAKMVGPGGTMFVSVGMGRRYFDDVEADRIERALRDSGLTPVVDRELDYRALGRRRRSWPLHDLLWAQTHKRVFISRRA